MLPRPSYNDVPWHLLSTTVSLTPIHHVAAETSREFSYDRACQNVAQCHDGIGHVTLRALGSREVCNPGVGKVFLIEWSFFRAAMFKTICQQEAVGRDTQGGVMMKSTPAPSLVVAQAELPLELLIVPFNAPAHLSDLDQFHQRRFLGQRRQPILRRFGLPGWPFNQQPLLLTKGAA